MPQLFDRFIEFEILDSETNDSIKWNENKINVSLSKDISIDNDNTGSVSVTNVSRFQSKLISNTKRQRIFFYTIKAGYSGNVHLISQGHVQEISWRHGGGDLTIDFTISEGSKFLRDPFSEFNKRMEKGESVYSFINRIRKNIPVRIIGNQIIIDQEFRDAKLSERRIFDSPIGDEAQDILEICGFTYLINNGEMVIYRDNASNESDRAKILQERMTSYLVKLNFDTGLLNASLDTSVDYQSNIRIPFLSFKSLFIPQLIPLSVVRFDEQRYQHLLGDYFIQKSTFNLNNKGDGDFSVSSRALDIHYSDNAQDSVYDSFQLEKFFSGISLDSFLENTGKKNQSN